MATPSTQAPSSRRRRDVGRSIVAAYVVALLVFVVIGVTAVMYFGRFGRSSEWVRHTEQVLAKLSQGIGELKDAQTGQRGYIITRDEQFLEPFERSSTVVRATFDELTMLTADNPAQQERLRLVRPLVDEKLAFVTETIEVARRGDREQAIEMVRSRRGKQIMDEIRARIAEMEAEERALLVERMQQTERAAWAANVLIVFGNGFAFALLAGGTFLLGRELNRRNAAEEQLELRRAKDALSARELAQNKRFEAVLDEMPLGIALLEAPTGRISFGNRRMRALMTDGAPAPDAGTSKLDLLRFEGAPYRSGEAPTERALRGEVVCGEEIQLRRADGTTAQLLASVGPVRDREGKITAAVAAFDDFSGGKRDEEERRQAERFRDLFVGALGHDLRNPLSVITAGAASLARRSLRPEETKVVSRMGSSADRMARMIDQLLDMTQARLGGGIPISPKLADLGAIARRAVERIEVTYPERTVSVELQGDLGGEWDPERMGQVLAYLLVNAVEHGRADAPIELNVRGESDRVVAAVHNANAIPPDLLPLIFDPFRRAAERRRLKSTGLGLGLYLAMQIVREHGGEIGVDSSSSEGTTLCVILPRRAAPVV
jgi:signal transduction histidine kinase